MITCLGTYMWRDRVVTVESDRSIEVQQGDSLSAYSMAIYGDFDHINCFTRKGNEYIVNKNQIRTGERIYHLGPLPDEPVPPSRPAVTVPNAPAPNVNQTKLYDLLQWMYKTASPMNGWRFVGGNGADASVSIFTGQFFSMGFKEAANPSNVNWYRAIGLGLSGGLELGMGGSVSLSIPGAWSNGVIGKFPTAGSTLDKDEINGSYLLFEIAAGLLVGGSASVFVFGCKSPPEMLLNNAYRILAGNGTPILPILPAGFVVMAGVVAASPNAGVAVRGGYMTDIFS